MRCQDIQEAISARLDTEAADMDDATIDDHLSVCSDCRAFEHHAGALAREMRVRAADHVPDLTGSIMAAAPATRRAWPRYVLLWLGLTQLVLAVPALAGDGRGASAHVARELGSWDVALAVGLLVAFWQPRRAAGLLPFALALAGATVLTATIDIVTGRAPLSSELLHAVDVVSVAALWLTARAPSGFRSPMPTRGLRAA